MKIRFTHWLMVLFFWGTVPSAKAQFQFTTNNGAITITGYNTAAGYNPVIPATINGYPVTAIGDNAFRDYRTTTISNVTIPNSVVSIGEGSFYGCISMLSITIPNSVISIGRSAFSDCRKLTSVTIPDSVTTMGEYVFNSCDALKSVSIGSGVTNIAQRTFSVCNSLTNFTVSGANLTYSSSGGVLFNKPQTALVCFPTGKDVGGSYTVTNTVTSIGAFAFYVCRLANVTIPNSVTNIGVSAFESSFSLNSITIPNSVISIGVDAFRGCISLVNVNMPNSVTDIGLGAFSGCYDLANFTVDGANPAYSSLDGVLFDKSKETLIQFPAASSIGSYIIPGTVTNIGYEAFGSCLNLTNVIMPDGLLVSMGVYAFVDCYGLKSVNIPNSLTTISEWAFAGCSSLTGVSIPEGVISIGVYAFAYCEGLTSVSTPNGLTTIGEGTFTGCAGLTSVTIPNSVTNIGSHAFSYCSGLNSITIGSSVAVIGNNAFFACPNLFSLTIPASVTNIFQYAFANCSKLKEVYFLGNPPTYIISLFQGTASPTVYYLPNAVGWGPTFAGQPTAITPLANGRTSNGAFPVIFYPLVGTNFTLQASTSPLAGNWIAVSNAVRMNAVQLTNFSRNAFFRLRTTNGSPPSPIIGSYGGLPVWIWPTNANHLLQVNTSLTSTNWLTDTNGNTFIGVQVTNVPSDATFRLH